jgi:Protein of unknown function (DUF938)
MPDDDARQMSPAAERNKQPILEALQRVLPPGGLALEIASGTGQHVVHFAAALPGWVWQPSDPDPDALESIEAWRAHARLPNVRMPLRLDVMGVPWPVDRVDAIHCCNLLHIAPWAACAALMSGAARHLSGEGRLMTYGPYLVDGVPTAPSNLAFDADLRSRNPQWGLRRLDAVVAQARACGFELHERVPMPANNLMLVFGRSTAGLAQPE